MGKSVVDIGNVLVDVLKQAIAQQRVTFGVFECAEVLEMCPEQVMLCVLPKLSDEDIPMSIQHKLIEAHCWENGVNLVKVDSLEKLVALLTSFGPKQQAGVPIDRTVDFSCLLIGFPVEEMSDQDFQITKYSYLFQETEMDAIPLPD